MDTKGKINWLMGKSYSKEYDFFVGKKWWVTIRIWQISRDTDAYNHGTKAKPMVFVRKGVSIMIVETALLQDYSKHKLLEYADSFRELADSFLENMSCDMEGEQNRKDIIWNRQLSEQRSIFAGQLKEVSQMIEAVAEENCKMEYLEEKKALDPELKQRIDAYYAEYGASE